MTDGLEIKIRTCLWYCRVCDCLVTDPENHQYHAVIRLTDDSTPDNPAPTGAGRGPT